MTRLDDVFPRRRNETALTRGWGVRSRPPATDPASPDGAQPKRGSARVPRGPAIPAAGARRPRCTGRARLDPRALRHAGPRRAEPLAAGRVRGQKLAGIHDPVGIEDAAQARHEVQIGLAVLEREVL